MNRLSCLKTAVVALLLLSLSVVLAQVSTSQPFSADFSVVGKASQNMTGKFFVSLPNSRMDVNAHGRDVSMIANGSTGTSYAVMHKDHIYMEMKPGQRNPMAPTLPEMASFDPKNPCSGARQQSGATCKDLGSDSSNGRPCEKWLITDKNGVSTTLWIDNKLHFPIKSLGSDGTTFELSNIKEGAQAASLFEPPAGYTKMDMGGMMGGRPPQ